MQHIRFFVEVSFFTGEDKFVEPYYEHVKGIANQFNGTLHTTPSSIESGKEIAQVVKYLFQNEQDALNFKLAFEKEENMSYCTIEQETDLDGDLMDAAGGSLDDASSLDKFAHELGESIMQHVLEHHPDKSKNLDIDTLVLSLESVDKMYDTYRDELVFEEEEEEDTDTEKLYTKLDMLKSYQTGVLDGISGSSSLICGLTHPFLGDKHESEQEI